MSGAMAKTILASIFGLTSSCSMEFHKPRSLWQDKTDPNHDKARIERAKLKRARKNRKRMNITERNYGN